MPYLYKKYRILYVVNVATFYAAAAGKLLVNKLQKLLMAFRLPSPRFFIWKSKSHEESGESGSNMLATTALFGNMRLEIAVNYKIISPS